MWLIFFIVAFALFGAGIIYLAFNIAKILPIEKKWRSRGVAFGIICIIGLVLWLTMGATNMLVCILHLVIFWLIIDLIKKPIKRFLHKDVSLRVSGVVAIALTVAYLSVGWYLDHNVWQTNYKLTTDKDVGSLRIVQLADSHVCTTFNGKELAKYTKRMQKLNPDVVLITGDFIDDGTTKQDMIDACAALKELHPKYGVYFAYGNHDRGYSSAKARGYAEEEFIKELEKNNVQVLCDKKILIDDRFYIIGREDYSAPSRHNITDLVNDVDRRKYIIVMDHQPHDYDNEAASRVDLVLSGHTHGGQLIPLGLFTGALNDRTYGYEKRDATDFIVTSGISDWAIKFKTGTKSEFNVIDIN